jgi:hypothetical protein
MTRWPPAVRHRRGLVAERKVAQQRLPARVQTRRLGAAHHRAAGARSSSFTDPSPQVFLVSLPTGADRRGRRHCRPRPSVARPTFPAQARELRLGLSPNRPKRRLLPLRRTTDGGGSADVEAGPDSTRHRPSCGTCSPPVEPPRISGPAFAATAMTSRRNSGGNGLGTMLILPARPKPHR